MLSEEHLLRGLNALGRAHSLDYFMDGHRGAALIAGYYLCGRDDCEPKAARAIAAQVGREWTGSELWAPFEEDTPDPRLLGQLTAALVAGTDCLRQAGHNVILPSLGLKAMGRMPETVTPARLAGMCRLVQSFTPWPYALTGEDVALPGLDDLTALARFILAEALDTMRRFEGRGQGWTGHLLTHGQAVVDLVREGHATAAEGAREGLALYVKRTRMGPSDGDPPTPERPPTQHGPLTARHWEERLADGAVLGIGHCLKYPYALYSLLDTADDPGLREEYQREAYRVL